MLPEMAELAKTRSRQLPEALQLNWYPIRGTRHIDMRARHEIFLNLRFTVRYQVRQMEAFIKEGALIPAQVGPNSNASPIAGPRANLNTAAMAIHRGTCMTERTGRCLCGAVNFKLAADPVAVRICWCRDCQHIAANGTVNAIVSTEELEVVGVLAEHAKVADSGNLLTRQFCPICGTHLFGISSARPQFRVVRTGNFDDPSSIQPDMNIWTSSAPSWACLDKNLEQVDRQPQPMPKASTDSPTHG